MNIITSLRVKSAIQKELQEKFPEVHFFFHPTMEEAKADIENADILVTYGGDLNEEILERAKRLKWIMVLSAGIEKLPFEALKKRNILITNARGIHKVPMAEYTFAMIMQVTKKMKQLIENEKNEVWDRTIRLVELAGKTITILGAGAIGCEIARVAKAFNMKTIGVNRSGQNADYMDEIYSVQDLEQALVQADFVVSVLPSTKETYHLLKENHFKMMKNECVFINIGRGDIVEESVLLKVLEDGEIAHAVLDVFESEPLPEGHPFWKMENVTVTPHISGLSALYQQRAFQIFEHNLINYLSGNNNNLKNVIDLDRGY
ncbi:D-2-hydroxyacid dehydrogenase [Calidifontibacillus erzurumensis]|uniref:D-2-hydroxyacid dehydrogenase n=1 Tax=Calidifontibacillus erzurumensis TaxID=2741433 RepID=A0A8J8KCL4_9BACI|nr:D-2-hydroxyacid dehydrogenase [Calidifontibacillus erzurumensis]NSL52118.1 D-2-hydroxyacid dehydrogenase [Calidifontibacillus erzurumensis]